MLPLALGCVLLVEVAGQNQTSRAQHSAGQAEKALSVFRYCANLILIIEFIIDTVQRGEVPQLGLHTQHGIKDGSPDVLRQNHGEQLGEIRLVHSGDWNKENVQPKKTRISESFPVRCN